MFKSNHYVRTEIVEAELRYVFFKHLPYQRTSLNIFRWMKNHSMNNQIIEFVNQIQKHKTFYSNFAKQVSKEWNL